MMRAGGHYFYTLRVSKLVYLFLVTIKEPSEKSCVFSRLLVTAVFAFCVITFEPIEVQTCSAPQNDRLNLSFVIDIHAYAKK